MHIPQVHICSRSIQMHTDTRTGQWRSSSYAASLLAVSPRHLWASGQTSSKHNLVPRFVFYHANVMACFSGRKFMCLVFCGTYAASSLIVLLRSLPFLLVGRLLGGISTVSTCLSLYLVPLTSGRLQSILFSCFEAWLIASAHDLGLPDTELSSILSRCTFINGIVAALSGVFSNAIVNYYGTVKAPFVCSAVCLGLAALAIRTTWGENYGQDAEGMNGKSRLEDSKLADEEVRQSLVEGNGNGSSYRQGGGIIQTVLKGVFRAKPVYKVVAEYLVPRRC